MKIFNKDKQVQKGSVRYFWLYACILFVVAGALVVFSAKLQNDSIKDLENMLEEKDDTIDTSQGMISSIQSLNELLTEENSQLKAQLESLKEENSRLEQAILREKNAILLAQAQQLYYNKEMDKLSQMFSQIDQAYLPESLIPIYTQIKNSLE